MDLSKINESIEWSKRQLEKSCKERLDAVRQFVGAHYSDKGSPRRVPVNMLELATTIYLRLLAAHEPKCLVNTEDFSLKPFASELEIVLNQLPREIGLLTTIRRAVMEAMFSIGVAKVGIGGTSQDPRIGDDPFVSLVQADDYFVDMSAKSWDEIQYEGNEYWMTVEDVKSTYGVDLEGDDYHGDSATGVEQANGVASGESRQPLYEKILIRDVYLPRENEMVTYAVESRQELRRIAWDGPEGTPYIKLWFTSVPGNLMPLAPIAVWKDLHELVNQIFRKLANQGVAKKTVAVFQGGSDEEISRFNAAHDGDAIRYNGARPEEITVGGPDNGNLAFALQLNNLFNMFAGNLDSLGGLSASSSTASQDKLINEAASARLQDMSERTVEFVREIFKRLAWYVWTDPVRERTYMKHAMPEYGVGVRKQWTPETRDGNFLDYNFDISVFSMQDDSPSTRVQKLTQLFQTFVLPMLQQLQEQGAYIDMGSLMDYLARNTNMPELNELIKFQNKPQVQLARANEPQPSYVSTKSPYTKRVYERVGRSGMTRQGRDAVMMNMLLGGNLQNAEKQNALEAT